MPETTPAKDRLREITAGIETGIQELFESEKYAEYLRTMSRFHRYSVNNQMLIFLQRPDATLVAGFSKWHDQFGRSVLKGEKGIKIIAPTPYKKRIEEQKLDPDTKLPVLDADGSAVMVEKEITVPMFKVVSVFDVSQTDGRPLPALAADLVGDVKNYEVFMEALRRSSPVPVSFEKLDAGTDGYFSPKDQRIALREGMSEVQTVSAAVHEITHAKLHNRVRPEARQEWKLVMVSEGGVRQDLTGGFEKRAEAEAEAEARNWEYIDENGFVWNLEVAEDSFTADLAQKSRRTAEVEAESVSFAVCAYYGIATGENSFGYIAAWSRDHTLPELRESLETINKTANGLITDIDRSYAEICSERGIGREQDEALFLVDGRNYLHIQAGDDGWDYTLYDAATKAELDGGRLTDPALSMADARREIFAIHGLAGEEAEPVELSYLDELIDAQSLPSAVEQSFRDVPGDSFAIYQLRNDDALGSYRFANMAELTADGLKVERGNYEAVYTAPLTPAGTQEQTLEKLYEQFNVDRPADFTGHSLSVSDIIALRQGDKVSCHYVDSFGFAEIPGFLPPEGEKAETRETAAPARTAVKKSNERER